MKTLNLEKLPNWKLAHIFFQYLYSSYDSGGISVRRTLRSALLEDYLDLFNCYLELKSYCDDTEESFPTNLFGDLYSCYNEAKKRNKVEKEIESEPLLPFSCSEISVLDLKELAYLALAGLLRWHEEHRHLWDLELRKKLEKSKPGILFLEADYSVETNERLIKEVAKLLPLPVLEQGVDIKTLEVKIYRFLSEYRATKDARCVGWNWLPQSV